jgi:hypothetical protein
VPSAMLSRIESSHSLRTNVSPDETLIGHRLRGTTARYGEVREGTLRHKADEIAGMIDGYMRANDAKVLPFAPGRANASYRLTSLGSCNPLSQFERKKRFAQRSFLGRVEQ